MELQLTTIHVNDLEESVQFYQDVLKLEEVKRFEARPGVEISILQDQGGTIELITGERKIENENSQMALGFKVKDLDFTIEKLEKQGVEILNGPIETDNGSKLAFIEDPNGIEITFIENLVLE